MGHTWWTESSPLFKVLLEPEGAIFGLTLNPYSYLLIISRRFVGIKKIRTQDRIVARAFYNTRQTLALIQRSYPRDP